MGAVDIFASPAHRAFYTEDAGSAGTPVHVSRLEVGGEVAAANLGLVFEGRYYHVLASYSDGPVSRYGPGAAHLHELMRYAIGRGCALFDFTIGDEKYKRDWCEIVLKLYDYRAAVTPQGWLLMLPATGGAMVKRFIKQTPVLWRVATKVRAVLADVRQRLRPERRAKDDAGDE
jgi:CelD/BcsL family acetyltransferase involved in cellulose biosynthesis